MNHSEQASYYSAHSTEDALDALHERGANAQVMAGATWLLREPLRAQPLSRDYVSLSRIEGLKQIVVTDEHVRIGSCVTHTQLARQLRALPICRALELAASNSANPAVRNVATVGGNLCAVKFPAADLVPALMALGAQVQVRSRDGVETFDIEHFLAIREQLPPAHFVDQILLDKSTLASTHSSHARLPLRKAGDYPVAIVSVAASVDRQSLIRDIRIAVGSIEALPRRWTALENWARGKPLDVLAMTEKARDYASQFQGRDSVEAPAWYRVKVLPTLLGRALAALVSH